MLIGSSQLPVRQDSVAQRLQAWDFSVASDLSFLAGLGKHMFPWCSPTPKNTMAGPSAQAAQVVQAAEAAPLKKYHLQPSQLPGAAASSGASVHAPIYSCVTTSNWCSFLLQTFLSSPQHPATNQMFPHCCLLRSCLLQQGALHSSP